MKGYLGRKNVDEGGKRIPPVYDLFENVADQCSVEGELCAAPAG